MKARWRPTTIQEFVDRGEIELKTGPFGTQLHASDYVAHGTPVINVRNIGFGIIVPEKLEYISDETVERLASHLLKADDIVFGRKGAVERHAFMTSRHDRWFQGSDCVRLRVNSSNVLPRFLSYLFLTEDHKQWMMNQCSHGATMASLNQTIICRIPLRLPPPPKQQDIVSILSAYDDLIENNTRRIKILEDTAQMIYREWFVNFRFPGHEKVRMVDSELGPIPEGWQPGILRDVCDSMDYGYTDSASLEPIGPKFLRITDIVPSVIDWHRVPYCASPERNPERYALREGDIVVARTGATTGYAKRFNKKHPPSIFASYLVRLRIKPKFSNHLFGVLVESDDYKKFIQGNWSGAAQPQANAQVLTSIPIVIAPEPLQRRFSVLVEPLFDLKEALHFKNLNLRTTRDLLLPKLISGEIPVEVAGEAPAEIMEEVALHA
jgi:type I restriction enzyme S subunit